MSNPQVLVLFLKALIAARKSVGLYPAGSEMANVWVERLQRSLGSFFEQGLVFPIRVDRDRFAWPGDDVLTLDPDLETLRFDLESRGIAEFTIEPAVEGGEILTFLELLNRPARSFTSIADAAAQLRERGVRRVTVRVPAGGRVDDGSPDAAWEVLQAGKDALDLFVEAVLAATRERFDELSYDRVGLGGWLEAVADGHDVEALHAAVRMLGAMADDGSDREIRTRTLLEGLLTLPPATLGELLTTRLIPQAGSDLVAFNLLTQLTEDELAEVARLVPEDQLLSLGSELLEFPWEAGKRQRLVEAITAVVGARAGAGEPPAPGALLGERDPLLAELREEIVAGSRPDVLLERSTDILLALVFNVESEDYPAFAVDGLEEVVGEGLARANLPLAIRILRSLVGSQLSGQKGREHQQRISLFRRRMAGRTQVSLVAGLLRQPPGPEGPVLASEYLRLAGREAIEEFTNLLAEEKDRRVRGRMCQVLIGVGPPVARVLLPWLEDSRWFVVRNIVYVLGRAGDSTAFSPVAGAIDHSHFRVRMEAIRSLILLGEGLAIVPVLRKVADPDAVVRLAAVKALGTLKADEAVAALRDLAAGPAILPEDLDVREAAVAALGSIGTPLARTVLERLGARRLWPWQRAEIRLRRAAVSALRAAAAGARSEEGDDD